MNFQDSLGESSSKRQENGDALSGPERPLKKARFAWQVKGKYHLKNETTDIKNAATSSAHEPVRAGPSSEMNGSRNTFIGNTEQNLEILGDYLLKQDFNTLDSVITDHDKSLLTPSTRISSETLQYPRYISSCESNRSITQPSNANIGLSSVPMSMVVTRKFCEDQCIARWQARQMAKGFVDNTINRVLDSWTHPPMPPDMDNSRFLALDVAEFINNLPGDNSIENEGILMAISAHGLQNTSNSSNKTEDQTDSSSSIKHHFISPPSSPLHSDEYLMSTDSNHKQETEHAALSDLSWSYSDDNTKKDDDVNSFSLFQDSNAFQYFSDNSQLNSSGLEYDGDINSSSNHFDFMDAAVSFAIQNKGLTAFGTEYG